MLIVLMKQKEKDSNHKQKIRLINFISDKIKIKQRISLTNKDNFTLIHNEL